MSSYATIADLGKYGIPAAALADVALADQEAALDKASSDADSYLRDRFKMPLVDWDLSIRGNVAKMAAFELLKVRGFAPEGIDQSIRDGYNDAVRWFEKVASGASTPGVTDSSGETTSSPNGPFVIQPRMGEPDANGYPTLAVGPPRPRGW